MLFIPTNDLPETDNIPPSKVTGLSIIDKHDGKLFLSWNNATDNVGVVKYCIYRNNIKIPAEPITTNYVDSEVSAIYTYSYSVSAVDAANNIGNKSENVSGQPTYAYSNFYYTDINGTSNNLPITLTVGQDGKLLVSVECNEYRITNYTIKIGLMSEDVSNQDISEYTNPWTGTYTLTPNYTIIRNITLNHEETFEEIFTFDVLQAGSYKFELFLFNQDAGYSKQLYLFITVSSSPATP